MKRFGLIGYPLTHSFSKKFFTEKFNREGITDCLYELFEISHINQFPDLIANNPDLKGLNVTIPYKEAVLPYLDDLDASADKVGAVNVIKVQKEKLVGYNSDYFGFKYSLESMQQGTEIRRAVVLGTGGASKAVIAVLAEMGTKITLVSRSVKKDVVTYDQLVSAKLVEQTDLIVNTTPLGMYPGLDQAPAIPYEQISEKTMVYDLIYNPEVTKFLQLAGKNGARIKNGLEMLEQQALKSWEIWQA
jgi:shikimate dehydrogenase